MAERACLVDLLILRGEVPGRIADYERAAELAQVLVRDEPDDGAARLARAGTLATFDRFHAADFWLTVGGDRSKGHRLALRNHIGLPTRAPEVLHRVIPSD